jgi:biotin transport system substrate-specific component
VSIGLPGIGLPSIERLPSFDRARAGERGITIGDLLVPLRISDRMGVRARHLALILAGALLIALGAQVSFPIPGTPVPVTGQTFGVLVAGGALGFRRGIASVLLYVLLGALGLPLFALGETGLNVILGVRGGYLVGFVLAGAIVGRLAELGWDRNLAGSIGAMLLGEVAIYAVGVPWLAASAGLDLGTAVQEGLTPFLLGDGMKMVLAAVVFPAAWWVVGRRPGDR